MKHLAGFGLKTMSLLWFAVFISSVSISEKAYSLFRKETSFQDNINTKEIDNLEYAVYTDFFGTEKLPTFEVPEFFEYAIKSRRIFEITDLTKEIKKNDLSSLQKSFGQEVSAPFEDYHKKNAEEFQIKDRIMVPDMTVFSKEQRDELFSGGFSEVPSHVTGEYVSVSRIGFNEEKDTAFFHLKWNGSALTSYFVMMQKKEDKWIIINVIMDSMIIF